MGVASTNTTPTMNFPYFNMTYPLRKSITYLYAMTCWSVLWNLIGVTLCNNEVSHWLETWATRYQCSLFGDLRLERHDISVLYLGTLDLSDTISVFFIWGLETWATRYQCFLFGGLETWVTRYQCSLFGGQVHLLFFWIPHWISSLWKECGVTKW
jgi:hypothetical protein